MDKPNDDFYSTDDTDAKEKTKSSTWNIHIIFNTNRFYLYVVKLFFSEITWTYLFHITLTLL